MIADGFVVAHFSHRTARLGDPHLHWHVLVANMARGIDGRWTALDGQALYQTQRTVGVLFQTAMRRELTEQLGVQWGPIHRDSAEVAGIPSRVLREFSQRSEQIAEWMENRGVEGAAARSEALLETRTNKQTPADFAAVEAAWRERADQLGWGPTQLDALLSGCTGVATDSERWMVPADGRSAAGDRVPMRSVSFDEWVDWLVTSRVTEKSGTFTRFDLTQAVGAVMPAGTDLATVERTVNRALSSSVVVQVGDHWTERRPVDAPSRTVSDERQLLYS